MSELIYKQESYDIVGAAMAVHQELGCGFNEEVFQEAFELELIARGIPYEREKVLKIQYRGATLKKTYKVDFVCYGEIVVELKALETLASIHETQVINYLKASQKQLGILINFGEKVLKHKQIVRLYS